MLTLVCTCDNLSSLSVLWQTLVWILTALNSTTRILTSEKLTSILASVRSMASGLTSMILIVISSRILFYFFSKKFQPWTQHDNCDGGGSLYHCVNDAYNRRNRFKASGLFAFAQQPKVDSCLYIR